MFNKDSINKTALITGSSSGIGKEFAIIHAAYGGNLVLVARREEKLSELKTQLEGRYNANVHIIAKDLSEKDAALEIYQTLKEEKIEINYLINNAGFGARGKYWEQDWETNFNMINLNIVCLSQLTRLFLPDMVERNEGRILNVSSTASLMPGPLQSVYFATKAFVTSFSNALNEELRNSKVTVSALLPGATKTEFAQRSDMENTQLFESAYAADKVAKSGYEGMLKGELNIIAGVNIVQKLMLKMIPLVPKRFVLKQIRKMQELK